VTTTVYVGNLPWRFTEDELAEVFAPVGRVVDVRIIADTETGRSKGYGFVEVDGVSEQAIISALNGVTIKGRALTVRPANPHKRDQITTDNAT
jgi:RNA recognition motif-containing protein